jgi:hypothetical protein
VLGIEVDATPLLHIRAPGVDVKNPAIRACGMKLLSGSNPDEFDLCFNSQRLNSGRSLE